MIYAICRQREFNCVKANQHSDTTSIGSMRLKVGQTEPLLTLQLCAQCTEKEV